MAEASTHVKDLLVAASIGAFGGTNDWAIFIGKRPDKPDNSIVIWDSGGLAPNPRWLLNQPDVTVVVRSQDYAAGLSKMRALRDALLGLPATDQLGDRIDGIVQVGEFAYVGNDEKERAQFSATFRLWLEPANTAGDKRDPL